MFEHLKQYKHILVSGCQRSGTNLCTRIIQYDLDIPKYVALGNGIKSLDKHLNEGPQKVYHAPGASRWLEEYGDRDDVVVIWMRRDFEDVLRSAKRINWKCNAEMTAYGLTTPKKKEARPDKVARKQKEKERKKGRKKTRMEKRETEKSKEERKALRMTQLEKDVKLVYDAKYKYWEEVQRPHIKHYFVVEYESLKDHVMWVKPPDRKFPHAEATVNGRKLDGSLDALLGVFPKKGETKKQKEKREQLEGKRKKKRKKR